VNLFLDTSVVLAACGRPTGASHFIFDNAETQGWRLQTSSYVWSEVDHNLPTLTATARQEWLTLRARLQPVPDIVSFEWATVFAPAKDRPILFTAVAWADVLLTLDRRDFEGLLGNAFYRLPILRPGDFLKQQRATGRLRA
jgi:predicted nucleic acid-binding protein